MTLLRFLLCLLTLIGTLAAAGVMVLRFPPLLIAVLLTCWVLSRLEDVVGKLIG